jgi:hypothetical protein
MNGYRNGIKLIFLKQKFNFFKYINAFLYET